LGDSYTDSGLVITTDDGWPFHPETLSGLFVRHAKRAGLPPIRLHDLRHSVVSILLARGVHPKVVSEMLGHATIALTLDTYITTRRAGVGRRGWSYREQPKPARALASGLRDRSIHAVRSARYSCR
jgi:integrase